MDRAGRTSVDAAPPLWQVPRLDPDRRLVAGVAAGVAREVGLDPLWVRLAVVLLAAAGGWGVALYGGAWAAMAWWAAQPGRPEPLPPQPKGATPATRAVGFALVVLGALGAIDAFGAGFAPRVVWPVGVVGLGLLVAWRQADGAGDPATAPGSASPVPVVLGLALAVGGATALLAGNVDVGGAWTALVAAGAVVVGLGLLSAPWWLRLADQLSQERQRRIRSDERAEVAAHLHDSVLQTLAMIQRKAQDPQAMVALARRQERELRNWLDPDRASRLGGSLRGQLDDIATEVEDLHGVAVEVVVVGDCLVDEALSATVAAAREAVVNAAKHAGVDRIDVYAEVRPSAVEVFVRDTGVGFDPSAVAEDRHGLRHSIHGRMQRVGGWAEVTAAAGEGTEVELHLPLPDGGGGR